MLSTTQVLLASVFVAETCHFVWKRKEPDARFVLAFMALAQILLPALFVHKSHQNIYESLRLTAQAGRKPNRVSSPNRNGKVILHQSVEPNYQHRFYQS